MSSFGPEDVGELYFGWLDEKCKTRYRSVVAGSKENLVAQVAALKKEVRELSRTNRGRTSGPSARSRLTWEISVITVIITEKNTEGWPSYVRLLTEWRDAGSVVPRSRTTSRRVLELDEAVRLLGERAESDRELFAGRCDGWKSGVATVIGAKAG
jgi:hypothetical protein